MKWKKRKQLTSWLLVLMLIFNVFLPINTAWANGTDTTNNGTEISSNGGGTNETEVTDPSGSADETEVTDPSGSTDETEVTEPSNNTNETEVTEPSESTDETEAAAPSESTDETEASNESTVPEETETAAEPEVPATSSNALASQVSLLPEVFTAEDRTGDLMNLDIALTQDGVPIPENGTLTSTENIAINVSFRVPVEGDDFTGVTPQPTIVRKGDTARLELSDAFQLVSGTTVELKDMVKGVVLGNVTFTSENGIMYADITFDGEDEVFDGTYNAVKGNFSATLKYDPSGSGSEEGDHIVTILGKTFIVTVPPVETIYKVEKSGKIDPASKSIEWTVAVTANKGGTPVSLEGYRFSDDLTDVGAYIGNSFTVGGDPGTPDQNGNVISYVFPQGTLSPQTLTFKTAISDDVYYSNAEKQIGNKAELWDGDTLKADGSASVTYEPTWITKTGKSSDAGSTGAYDPKNRTITWTITANQVGATLENVVITDQLPKGLSFQSATWQAWNGSSWDNPQNISPDTDGKYSIGNINSQILLTIVTKVDSTDVTTGYTYYKNSASITWNGLSGSYGADSGNVGVGYAGFTKKSTSVDTATGQIGWEITVNPREQTIPNLKVYDLLVYGSKTSGFDISTVSGIPAGIDTAKLKPQYNHKYVGGTFDGAGLSLNVIPIFQENVRVADLLEITGFPNGASTSASTFTFKSQITDPEILASNKITPIHNIASLFSSNGWINEATASRDFNSKVLAKEMLKREAMADPATGVNNRTTDASAGFDYVDKSVIFRLSVNANGMDWENVMGKATVTDTLPDGWVFDKIGTADYLIFAGAKGNNGSVDATGSALASVAGLTSGSFIGEKTATFTFDSLKMPYVILVKARPTSEKAAGYFNANKTTTERNNLSLEGDKYTSPVTASWQDVSIASQLLGKSLDIPKAGELLWKVDYKPYSFLQSGTVLKDTLPAGIDLRMNSNGTLILGGGNITAHEMTLNADGSYTLGSEVTLVLNENVFYDNSARVLSFNIPDSQKAYRFEYITDVTGEPGTISNEVSLYGSNGKQEVTSYSYTITAADGGASMQKNGRITITKTDSSNALLAGAEFTLFALDGKSIIKKGVTDSSGTLLFKVIPDGEYILQETAAPAGYKLDATRHSLKVTTSGGAVISSIDGKSGTGSDGITVKNFLEHTVGSLIIKKTVAGNGGETGRKFDFTVTFGASGVYDYTGSGVSGGTIQSGDTISLADGESITITGLPKDTPYEVTEKDYSGSGYSVTSTGTAGQIKADEELTAAFINTKYQPGSLIISKTVTGNGADTKKKFDFTVTFDAAGSYSYTGKGVADGTIQSGDKISLADGESITITGLPDGTKYQVTEADYSSERYTTTKTGDAGTIRTLETATAAFVNNRTRSGGSGSSSGRTPTVPVNPVTIPNGQIPTGNMGGSTSSETVTVDGDVPKAGLPKTGDNRTAGMMVYVLFGISALLAMFGSASLFRKNKMSDK